MLLLTLLTKMFKGVENNYLNHWSIQTRRTVSSELSRLIEHDFCGGLVGCKPHFPPTGHLMICDELLAWFVYFVVRVKTYELLLSVQWLRRNKCAINYHSRPDVRMQSAVMTCRIEVDIYR